jgi:hypothetical protein
MGRWPQGHPVTAPARGALLRLRSGRNGAAVEQRNGTLKVGVKSKGFQAGQDTSLPEARSRRRDDESGQVAENGGWHRPRTT